jgi:hypothetical protein
MLPNSAMGVTDSPVLFFLKNKKIKKIKSGNERKKENCTRERKRERKEEKRDR